MAEDNPTKDDNIKIPDLAFEEYHAEYDNLWKSKDIALIGRILRCHLILEYCLNKWLSHIAPKISLESARLTFSQKLRIFGRASEEALLHDCIEEINRLRNKIAHTFQDPFDDVSTPRLNYFTATYQSKKKMPPLEKIQSVELFTHVCSAWLEGRMAGLVGGGKGR